MLSEHDLTRFSFDRSGISSRRDMNLDEIILIYVIFTQRYCDMWRIEDKKKATDEVDEKESIIRSGSAIIRVY